MPKQTKVGGRPEKKETKEQKRLRLLAEKESFDQCKNLLPIFGLFLLLLTFSFSLYVHNLPPAPPPSSPVSQKIDLRDFTIEQLDEMVEQSKDVEFGQKIEEYKKMLEVRMRQAEMKRNTHGVED